MGSVTVQRHQPAALRSDPLVRATPPHTVHPQQISADLDGFHGRLRPSLATVYQIHRGIEHAIRDELLADTGNAGLQATLNLGALEIVTGEFAALRLREPGGSEHVRVGDLEVVPFRGYDPADPFGQIRHGWRRLRPYLKVDPAVPTFVGMGSSGRRGVEEPE